MELSNNPLPHSHIESPGPEARAALLDQIIHVKLTNTARAGLLLEHANSVLGSAGRLTELSASPERSFSESVLRSEGEKAEDASPWAQLPFHHYDFGMGSTIEQDHSLPPLLTPAVAASSATTAITTSAPSSDELLCGICLDTFSLGSRRFSLHTRHPCATPACNDCAATFLRFKIAEKAVGPETLLCPCNCKEPLAPDDVRRFLAQPNEALDAAEAEALRAAFDAAHAEATALLATRDQRLRRVLPRMSEMREDLVFSLWRSGRDVRRCPGCRIIIEKSGGCQHMTCRSCRHEFWWCCGQNYRKSHNEVLCLPRVFAQHPSKYWGPALPLRVATKTVALGVGLGLGAVAAGAALAAGTVYAAGYLPAQGLMRLDNASGFKEHRRLRREAARSAAARAQGAALQRRRYLQRVSARRRSARDAARLAEVLTAAALAEQGSGGGSSSGGGGGSSGVMMEVTMEDVEAIEMARWPYELRTRGAPCALCVSVLGAEFAPLFRTPAPYVHHLVQHASGQGLLPMVEARRRVVAKAAAEAAVAGAAVMGAAEGATAEGATASPPSPRTFGEEQTAAVAAIRFLLRDIVSPFGCAAVPAAVEGAASAVDVAAAAAGAAAVRAHASQTRGGPYDSEDQVGQRCGCGAELPSVVGWCDHLAARNPSKAAGFLEAPAGCGVQVTAGVLCSCRACSEGEGDSPLCGGCGHPRMLHTDTVRGVKSPRETAAAN